MQGLRLQLFGNATIATNWWNFPAIVQRHCNCPLRDYQWSCPINEHAVPGPVYRLRTEPKHPKTYAARRCGHPCAALSNVFSAVFLIRVGLAPVQIFLAFAAILALRFIIRPVVLIAAPAMGLRRALICGTVLCSLSCPVLALVDGIGLALASFIVVSALGQVFYCTCYHVFFSALGDAERRGARSDWSRRLAPWRRSPARELAASCSR